MHGSIVAGTSTPAHLTDCNSRLSAVSHYNIDPQIKITACLIGLMRIHLD